MRLNQLVQEFHKVLKEKLPTKEECVEQHAFVSTCFILCVCISPADVSTLSSFQDGDGDSQEKQHFTNNEMQRGILSSIYKKTGGSATPSKTKNRGKGRAVASSGKSGEQRSLGAYHQTNILSYCHE